MADNFVYNTISLTVTSTGANGDFTGNAAYGAYFQDQSFDADTDVGFNSISATAAGTAYGLLMSNSDIEHSIATDFTLASMGSLMYGILLKDGSTLGGMSGSMYFGSIDSITYEGELKAVAIEASDADSSIGDVTADIYFDATDINAFCAISVASAEKLGSFDGTITIDRADGETSYVNGNVYGYMLGGIVASDESLLLYNRDTESSEGLNIGSNTSINIDHLASKSDNYDVYGIYATGEGTQASISFDVNIASGVGIAVLDGASITLTDNVISGDRNIVDNATLKVESGATLSGDTSLSNEATLQVDGGTIGSGSSIILQTNSDLHIMESTVFEDVAITLSGSSSLSIDSNVSLSLTGSSSITISDDGNIVIDLSNITDVYYYAIFTVEDKTAYTTLLDYLNDSTITTTYLPDSIDLEAYSTQSSTYGDMQAGSEVPLAAGYKGNDADGSIYVTLVLGGDLEYYTWADDGYGNQILSSASDATSADFSAYSSKAERLINGTSGEDVDYSFVSSSVSSSDEAAGGGIFNDSSNSSISIGNIDGDFVANSAISSGSMAMGGAIANQSYGGNDITIGNITGTFIGNYAESSNGMVYGGAISNLAENGDITIGTITGDFLNNYVYQTNAWASYGGAIYNHASGGDILIGAITGDFIGNYAYSISGGAAGGAIYNIADGGTIEMTFLASGQDILISGNYTSINGYITPSAITNYAKNSTDLITLNFVTSDDYQIIVNDSITGGSDFVENQILAIDGQVQFNNAVENHSIKLNSGRLSLGETDEYAASLSGSILSVASGAELTVTTDIAVSNSDLSFASGSTINIELGKGFYLDADSSLSIASGTQIEVTYGDIEKGGEYVLFSIANTDVYNETKDTIIASVDLSSIDADVAELNEGISELSFDYGDAYPVGEDYYSYTVIADDSNQSVAINISSAGEVVYLQWEDRYSYNSNLREQVWTGSYLVECDKADSDVIAFSTNNERITDNKSGENVSSSFIALSGENGGAISNEENEIALGKITGDFIGNSAAYNGGAIYLNYYDNNFSIESITGDFVGNKADSYGGAIYVNAESSSSSIGSITGDFIQNYAGTGGALYVEDVSIGSITGDFISNFASANAGAMYIHSASIGSIQGDFIGNATSATLVSESSTYFTGAINNENSTIDSIVGSFIGNYVESNANVYAVSDSGHQNYAAGAIVNYYGTISIEAKGQDLEITGNYYYAENGTEKVYIAIYNDNGTINFNAEADYQIAINDGISANSMNDFGMSNCININTSVEYTGTVSLNNLLFNQDVTVQHGTLQLGTYAGTNDLYGDGSGVSVSSAIASIDYCTVTVQDGATLAIATNSDGDSIVFSASQLTLESGSTLSFDAYASLTFSGIYSTISFEDGASIVIDLSSTLQDASYTFLSIENDASYEAALAYLQESDNITLVMPNNYCTDYGEYYEGLFDVSITGDGTDISLTVTAGDDLVFFKWVDDTETSAISMTRSSTTVSSGNALLVTTTSDDVDASHTAFSTDNTRLTSGTDGADVEHSFIALSAPSDTGDAYGGAISIEADHDNGSASIGNITGDFVGNTASSSASSAYGGAISNVDFANYTISYGDIEGDFVGNSASSSVSSAYGGAIYNEANYKIEFGIIASNFIKNSAYSTGEGSDSRGGAIYNNAADSTSTLTIEAIMGSFEGNYAYSKAGSAYGGAIYNHSSDELTISCIAADFIGNYALADGAGDAYGGAIYNYSSSGGDVTIEQITGDFIGNYAVSTEGEAYGGAIYNSASSGKSFITIATNSSDIEMTGNYTSSAGVVSSSAIYNVALASDSTATIYMEATEGSSIIINDSISGGTSHVTSQILDLDGDGTGTVEFNNVVENQTVYLNNITLSLGSYEGTSDLYDDGSNVAVAASLASVINSSITVYNGANLSIGTNDAGDTVMATGTTLNLEYGASITFEEGASITGLSELNLYSDVTLNVYISEEALLSDSMIIQLIASDDINYDSLDELTVNLYVDGEEFSATLYAADFSYGLYHDVESNYMGISLAQIPEPSTSALLLLALSGLCARRRRKSVSSEQLAVVK